MSLFKKIAQEIEALYQKSKDSLKRLQIENYDLKAKNSEIKGEILYYYKIYFLLF